MKPSSDAFFETLQSGFKQTIDWQVAVDGIQYADNPNFESPMPNYNEALNVLNTFGTRWQTTPAWISTQRSRAQRRAAEDVRRGTSDSSMLRSRHAAAASGVSEERR